MVPELQSILRLEVARGNEIVEVANWPPKCRLFVMLSLPFITTHALSSGLTYNELNDPHYWKAEYLYQEGLECLACRF
ncbi:hypothetical protein CTT39_21555 [Agrobacterium rosae]|nr:hypothetical protein CTT39_21555 [Agrobacterium rosae]